MKVFENNIEIFKITKLSEVRSIRKNINSTAKTFYQSADFFQLAFPTNHLIPILYTANKESKIIGSLLVVLQYYGKNQKRYNTRGLIIGGPVTNKKKHEKDIISALLKQLVKDLKKKCIYIEIRNRFDTLETKEIFNEYNFQFSDHLNFFVNLDLFREKTINTFEPNRRQQIKKSIEKGVIINEHISIEQFDIIYDLLKQQYKNKVKKPLPPKRFFKTIFENQNLKIIGIEYNQKIISGILLLFHNNEIVHEWYLCNSSIKYQNISPAVMATYAAITWASKNGFKKYDFMGAGKPNLSYGVRAFKKSFGGDLVNFGRYIRVNKKLLFILGTKFLPLVSTIINKKSNT